MTNEDELPIRGQKNRYVQMRRPHRKASWAKRRARFLDTLAATCNVVRSAEAAEMHASSLYERRRKDAVFAAQWDAAIQSGYTRLEALLIERAERGVSAGGTAPIGTSAPPDIATIDTDLALRLLTLHRNEARAKKAGVPAKEKVAREADTDKAILRMLKALSADTAR